MRWLNPKFKRDGVWAVSNSILGTRKARINRFRAEALKNMTDWREPVSSGGDKAAGRPGLASGGACGPGGADLLALAVGAGRRGGGVGGRRIIFAPGGGDRPVGDVLDLLVGLFVLF